MAIAGIGGAGSRGTTGSNQTKCMTVNRKASANTDSPAADETASHPLRKVLGLRDLSCPGGVLECPDAARRRKIFAVRLGSPKRITPCDAGALGKLLKRTGHRE
jgi:hypothetical protein